MPLRNAPDALRHPADGVAVEREVDQGVHERRNLIKGEMHGKRRDRLSQGRGEPFRPDPQEDVRRGQATPYITMIGRYILTIISYTRSGARDS